MEKVATPASVWKQLCRLAEGKRARPFGDMKAVLDRCALFEFSDAQIHRAAKHIPKDLSSDDDYSIPPFPFPEICVVGSGGAIVIRNPLMDDTGVLEFETMAFEVFGPQPDQYIFQMATCRVDSAGLDDDGRFPMTLHNLKRMWHGEYWDENTSYPSDEQSNPVINFEDAYADKLAELERARATASPEEIARREGALANLRAAHDRLQRLESEIVERRAELHELDSKIEVVGEDHLREAFYLGLQEVHWINHPDHFTIEVLGPQVGRKRKGSRIRRLGERPRHIMLTKSQIADAWHRVHRGGTHASPMPHLRRGHYKTLRSERYKENQGKRIWVRATHVNGACVEWRDGDVSYKVL